MNMRPSIVREVTPANPNQRVRFAGALLAAIAAWLRLDRSGGSAHLGAAISGAVVVFAAWALARELDPDRQSPAVIATLVGVGFVAVHRHLHFDVAGSFCIVLLARVALASPGLRPGLADAVGLAALAGLAADHQPGAVAAAGLCAACLVVTVRPLARDTPGFVLGGRDRIAASLTVVATTLVTAVVAMSHWPLPRGIEPPRYVEVVAVGLVGGILATIWCAPPRTEPDHVSHLARARAKGPAAVGDAVTVAGSAGSDSATATVTVTLSQARLRATRALTTLTLASAFIVAGPPAVAALAPAWFALGAAGIVAVFVRLGSRRATPDRHG